MFSICLFVCHIFSSTFQLCVMFFHTISFCPLVSTSDCTSLPASHSSVAPYSGGSAGEGDVCPDVRCGSATHD